MTAFYTVSHAVNLRLYNFHKKNRLGECKFDIKSKFYAKNTVAILWKMSYTVDVVFFVRECLL